jgi:hypothetical protein
MRTQYPLWLTTLFTGSFLFTRWISEPALTLTGEASFTDLAPPDPQSLLRLYQEKAFYHPEPPSRQCPCSTAYQQRYFLFRNTGQAFLFSLSDHNHHPLHTFSWNEKEGGSDAPCFPVILKHHYVCAKDHYWLTLTLSSFEIFQSDYTIRGPKKNFRIITDFYKKKEPPF